MKCGNWEVNVIKSAHHRYPWIQVWRMEETSGRLLHYWQRDINGNVLCTFNFNGKPTNEDAVKFKEDFMKIFEAHPVSLLEQWVKPLDNWVIRIKYCVMKTIKLLPTTGKLKTQISQWGDSWAVLMEMNDVHCLNGDKGFLICPNGDNVGLNNPAIRWVRKSDFEFFNEPK